MPDSDPDISRPRLIRDGSFLKNDWRESAQHRRAHNRLGFAYQVAFVRVLGRFPQQEPLETLKRYSSGAFLTRLRIARLVPA